MTKQKRRRVNPWSRPDVIDYVLDSYGGTETTDRGMERRVFLWADEEGEVWIGNTPAFVEHCAELFDFDLLPYDYVNVNTILIQVGERIRDKQKRRKDVGATGQLPMQPDKRKAR